MTNSAPDQYPSTEISSFGRYSCQACQLHEAEAVVLQAFSCLSFEGHTRIALAAFQLIQSKYVLPAHTMIPDQCGARYSTTGDTDA